VARHCAWTPAGGRRMADLTQSLREVSLDELAGGSASP